MARGHHLAQLNIGQILAPLEDPVMEGFMSGLDEINKLADNAPGFVWRLQTEEGNATAIRVFDDPHMLVNLSVWESLETLHGFTYHTDHRRLLQGRGDWFSKMDSPHLVMWWVPEGHIPTPDEAKERLELLTTRGPTTEAFTFAVNFESPV